MTDTTDASAVYSYLEERLGFQTSYYNEDYLDRRLTARMRRTGDESATAYLDRLESDEQERAALLDALSINVTEFFRNPEVWTALRDYLRDLTGSRNRVRVWSAACSDGREPYSVAMLAVADDEIQTDSLSITATDIDEDALERARSATYESTRTTDVAEELAFLDDPERVVDRDGDTFRVGEAARRLVTFDRHDLIDGSARADFDVVLCRNLLIYIDRSYKQPIFETLAGSLREGGYLVLGMTETLPRSFRDEFDPAAKRRRIYRKQ
ncbi:MAG: protein-glutamate O-methyltransferase CheR [Haloplanus sp.]